VEVWALAGLVRHGLVTGVMKGVPNFSSVTVDPVTQWPRARAKLRYASAASTIATGDADRDPPVALPDDLSRRVYCILGIPIDAIEMSEVLGRIQLAARNAAPFVISTPNVNFLINSRKDAEFREAVLESDLCPTDGMPLVWIARLLGTTIKQRVAGSDILDALKSRARSDQPLKVFLFGSTESVAAAAARALNVDPSVLTCIGWICPGFGTIEELSTDRLLEKINSSNANFLVAALGAKNGQLWLQRNHERLRIPIRAHLGAVINFQAGEVKRAPPVLRQLGLEWLWRIKEEPYLWRRYFSDGLVLLHLLITRSLPLAIEAQFLRQRNKRKGHDLVIDTTDHGDCVTLSLIGFAVGSHAEKAASYFRNAIAGKKQVVIDLSSTRAVDARFFGLLLMLRKQLKAHGSTLKFAGMSGKIDRLFRLHGLEYLIPQRKA